MRTPSPRSGRAYPRRTVLCLLVTALALSVAQAQDAPTLDDYASIDGKPRGKLETAAFGDQIEMCLDLQQKDVGLKEISGLAHSNRKNERTLWAVSDGVGKLFAIRYDEPKVNAKIQVSSLTVDGAKAHDWEDLAAFELDSGPFLLIADVGTTANEAVNRKNEGKPAGKLYFVKEPRPDAEKVSVAWTVSFDLPVSTDADIEAVAVDASTKEVLLVKRQAKSRQLLVLDLGETRNRHVRVGDTDWQDIALPAPAAWELRTENEDGNLFQTKYRLEPTALDVSGNRAVLLTYRHAYLYEREKEEGWEDAFSRIPVQVRLPFAVRLPKWTGYRSFPAGSRPLRMREALCFGPKGEALFVASEGGDTYPARLSIIPGK